MDEQRAIKLLDETFNKSYDDGQFSNFIRELFNGFNFSYTTLKNIKPEYKQYIDSYQILGSYTDSNKIIDILVVKLNKESASRDRARTKQRNFVAKYLSDNHKNAALVAFYGDDPEDWRFSFVKLGYHLESDESGKVKPVEELTPAKRYSYLVGVNEPNHTCKSQFLDLIIKEDTNPPIAEIEDAFSIDNVTKKFFLKYKELFLELKESLDEIIEKDLDVKEEFEEKSISTVDFSKKLLGQIVFLYFLQKKGWLGVEKGKDWGTGPKDFMIKLFGSKEKGISPLVPYSNFLNEILEPLFYDALANPRQDDDGYHIHFKCKIPFLNGGLFEPINNYNWVNTDILLENKIFEDIFETFNRFNFTVKEDEPLDKEVAVDPEMLGKVFENLLDVTDRKSKGAFYTPREIVHYMCQQSLINYLKTNIDVPVGDIETFIQHGELAQQITSRANVDEKYLPASIKKNYNKINDLLKNIKIVDPAVGSGAFPMGMMNEIVKARSILSWLSKKEKRTYYDLKRETIENCLYGVDIDSSAVDITKLRFWLSLVVDEADIQKIKPLPNLDHRIMCGNSLLEEFEGVKLFDEQLLEVIPETSNIELEQMKTKKAELNKERGEITRGEKRDSGRKKEIETELKKLDRKKKAILSRPKDETQQSTLDSALENRKKESLEKLDKLKRLQKAYFNEQNRRQKKELAGDIDRIEWELVEETLKEQGNEDAMQKLAQYKKNKSKPFFLWKLYFSEVFQGENPGFDVVIANPPYVEARSLEQKAVNAYRNYFFTAGNRVNTFALFTEKSIKLLAKGAVLSFIIHRNSIRSNDYRKMRQYILEKTKILNILSFKIGVFESVTGEMAVLILKNEPCKNHDINISFLEKTIDQKIKYKKIDQDVFRSLPDYRFNIYLTKPIISILNKLDRFHRLSKFANVKQGIIVGNEKKYVKNVKESNKFKPILRGKNISRYRINYNGEYVYYIPGTKVLTRGKTKDLFEVKEKILTQHVSSRIVAALDTSSYYYLQTINGIICFNNVVTHKYLLALLNSTLLNFYYEFTFNMGAEFTTAVAIENLNHLPIFEPNDKQRKEVQSCANRVLSITENDDYSENPDKQSQVKTLQNQIDQLVYKLYDLTPEEIAIVENFNKGK